MAKAKAKYNIKITKNVNDCTQGSVLMKLPDGSTYQLHYAVNPECKVRVAKGLINEYFEDRIPQFIADNPGAVCASWEE